MKNSPYYDAKLTSCEDERKNARRNLLDFTTYTKPDYQANWHHKVLAKMLDRVAAGQCRRLMVFLPPQHGKSELVSRRWPALLLGKDPDLRLIAASHTHELAAALNRDVQRILCVEEYRKLFPHIHLAARRPGALWLPRRKMDYFELDGHQGGLRSAGVGQSIAGLRADGAIIDDPFGRREEADSPVIRQKVWDWYANDLYTRLSAGAWVVLTHTRWHRDDLAGRLLQKMACRAADQWEVLSLPALRTEQGAGSGESANLPGTPRSVVPAPCSLLPALDTRRPGDPLWPQFKSAADLEIIRQQDARAFAALYQQDPAEATLADWPPEYFGQWIWVPAERWPRDFAARVVCVDASKGGQDRAGDYTAIVFMGVGRDGLLYVDAVLERIPLDQVVRTIIVFCDEHQPDYVGIEAEQFQEMLLYEFRRQCGERFEKRWQIWGMTTQGFGKTARIRRLTRYVLGRELRFRADSPGCRRLVDQLMDFPLAQHDDGPDALEMCVRLPGEVQRLQ